MLPACPWLSGPAASSSGLQESWCRAGLWLSRPCPLKGGAGNFGSRLLVTPEGLPSAAVLHPSIRLSVPGPVWTLLLFLSQRGVGAPSPPVLWGRLSSWSRVPLVPLSSAFHTCCQGSPHLPDTAVQSQLRVATGNASHCRSP